MSSPTGHLAVLPNSRKSPTDAATTQLSFVRVSVTGRAARTSPQRLEYPRPGCLRQNYGADASRQNRPKISPTALCHCLLCGLFGAPIVTKGRRRPLVPPPRRPRRRKGGRACVGHVRERGGQCDARRRLGRENKAQPAAGAVGRGGGRGAGRRRDARAGRGRRRVRRR